MQKDHFITSDGTRVDLIPGWYERKTSWPYGIQSLQEFADKCFDGTPDAYPKGYGFFVNKVVVFNYFREILNECFLGRDKFPMALDIGTGPGIQPRLLKAAGMCDEAWGIDILHRDTEFTDENTFEFLEEMNRTYQSRDKGKQQELANIIDFLNGQLGNWYPLPMLSTIFDPSRPHGLDKYVVDDFMTWDPPGGEKFDLITGIMCIEYFDERPLLKKVQSLLNPGGVFFVIVDYWHEVCGGSMQLPMDAPWLHCRLTREDLIRYYKEVRPNEAQAAETCIYFARSHLTPYDYNDAGVAAGMKLISARRSLLNNQTNANVVNSNEGGMYEYFHGTIVPQAKKVNPYFTPPDAFTQYLTLVFKKE
ncbi:methyltransferase domain-containing protein [Desulfatibacillum aliphaticivorans]|uniref:methyltransferase domain-containing protein n=1 Tax=Desulfatibacillum aliphaticivorans TaxID=218208 RepID=UPI00040D2AD2|nr:methyltransferase domain-containing protein [Desulfatibacillum aliphaticivorans]